MEIPSNDLIKLVNAATKDMKRPHLLGIRFFNGRAFATDGHIMTFIDVPNLKDELNEHMIPTQVVKSLPKHIIVSFNLTDKTLECGPIKCDLTLASEININALVPIDDIYTQEIKPTSNGFALGINPELLLKCAKAHPSYGKHKGVNLKINGLNPVKVYIKSELIGAVMPMRLAD